MKKNKPPKQKKEHFNNSPFKSLKGYKSLPNESLSKGKKNVSMDEDEVQDERALFLRALDGVKRMDPASGIGGPKQNGRTNKQSGPDPDEKRLFLQAMEKIGASLREDGRDKDDEIEQYRQRSASGRMKQLKRGEIRIREELDLHGYLKGEALVKLENFLAGAYSRGQRAVLVITGKGFNSPEGPVLRGAVAAWLAEKGKGMVAEFAPAPRDKGGSGAFVVFLKSK